MKLETIAISKVVANTGQVEGLPKNPRKIDASKLDKLKASIQQDRALMEARPLMVIERGGQYVTIGGNMRLEACRQLGWQEVPCVVLPLATDAETLKRYVLKDNASFGDWDFDALQVDFDMELLQACDIELPVFEDEIENVVGGGASTKYSNKELDVDGMNERVTITFSLSIEEHARIREILREHDEDINIALCKALGIYE